jgi:hypothetical protein
MVNAWPFNLQIVELFVTYTKWFSIRIVSSCLVLVVLNTWSDFLSRSLVSNTIGPHQFKLPVSRNVGMGLHAVLLTVTVVCIFTILVSIFGEEFSPNHNIQPITTYRWQIGDLISNFPDGELNA